MRNGTLGAVRKLKDPATGAFLFDVNATYTHLMPASSERTRKAVDDVLGRYNTVTSDPPKGPSVQVTGVSR